MPLASSLVSGRSEAFPAGFGCRIPVVRWVKTPQAVTTTTSAPRPTASPSPTACWFIDTDYNEESFFVRHAYFLGANDPYKALKTILKAEIDRAPGRPSTPK